jgi:hypothetical protein
MAGEESDWIDFGEIHCKSGKFLVIDPAFVADVSNGVVVKCPSGAYRLSAKVISYGRDRRVSRLRVLNAGIKADATKKREQIGEAWADVAAIGVCDAQAFAKIFPKDEEEAEELIENYLDEGKSAGSIIMEGHEDTPLCYVSSGFGDGTFPVYALTSGRKRIGFEVEFIEEGAAYPFGASSKDESRLKDKTENAASGAIFSALKLLTLMDQASEPVQEGLRGVAEELHQRVINRRKGAPPMQMKLTPCQESEISDDERAILRDLQNLGFVVAGHFSTGVGRHRSSLAVLPGTGIYADVGHSGAEVTFLIVLKREDRTSFSAQNYPRKPGITPPDWTQSVEMVGANTCELLTRVQAEPSSSPILKFNTEDIPSLLEQSFRRTQSWRAERGGWTRDEIKLQLNKPNLDDDEIEMWRFELSDMWLFNWLRAQSALPIDPLKELENLLIVHDDVSSYLLQTMWVWATGNVKMPVASFNDGLPRGAFARINEENGRPLRLVVRKTSGYPADYYIKA